MTGEAAERAEMAPRYNPSEVEARWYATWEDRGYFKPSTALQAPPFVITIPPPNVTGELHMGHALTYGIEDVLGRFKRMQGFNTLILPGTDHAGIATQNVVERQLVQEGTSRHELGRERFLERVWQWKEQYASNIRAQFQALGASFDWSRERFTMDPGYVDAVLEFFIRLYGEGQVYRGWRVINWCIRCHSAISDIEVEDVERSDSLYYLRYPLEDGTGSISVATVRPETMLGDVAVAVNPADERYAGLIGKTAVLPLLDRRLCIVGDDMVDMQFGTGAVKITPAHDFADFEVARRHGLEMPIAISQEATITDVGGPYAGETIAQARERVLRDLGAGGFLIKQETHTHNVPTCERCGTVLEPLLSEQWFMRMDELAKPAIEAVEDGRVRFVPDRWSRVYLDWMRNIRPWTLSRQLWWGHRVPVYYCANGHAVAAKSEPDACTTCGAAIAGQDPDVLDTWFSSALWPFATLGWPEETQELRFFYPTSFMNTSSQIIYLWIARMIMTGLKFMGDVPFPAVLINPTILNKQGQRMSKSLGTGIDPLDLIREFGADALRFGLMTAGSTHQQEIRFSTERVEQARNFANKVWNLARAVISNQRNEPEQELRLTPVDCWILSRLAETTERVTSDLEDFELSGAGNAMYDFVWAELADWYLEVAKSRFRNDADPQARFTARAVLWSVLDRVLRLLHPYMPFLTEEVWQQLRTVGSEAARQLSGWETELPESVMIASWPVRGERDLQAERDMGLIMGAVRQVRAVRSEYRVEPARQIPAMLVTGDEERVMSWGAELLSRLARLRPVQIYKALEERPRHAVAILVGGATLYLPIAEMTDVAAERARVDRELASARAQLESADMRLKDDSFVGRAPAHVVERERERARAMAETVRRLQERLDLLAD